MMIPGSGVLAALAAWGLTCAVHGTLLCGGAWLLARLRPGLRANDLLWKTALVGALATATVQSVAGVAPLGPRVSIPGARTVQVKYFFAEAGGVQVVQNRKKTVPSGPAAMVTSALALAWLLAAGYRLARLAGAHRRLRRCLAGRRALPEGELTRFAEELLGRRVRVTVSGVLPAPVALGTGEICLPERVLAELPRAQQRAVVAHEAAHLRRGDPLWLHLFGVVECLFFQPLQALALRRYREAAELLCDDWAASATGRPRDLARAIASIAGWLSAPRAEVPLAAIVEHGSPLMRRVRRLAVPVAEPPRGRAPLAAAALLLSAVLLAAPRAVVSAPGRPILAHREIGLRRTPDGRTVRFVHQSGDPAAFGLPPLPAPPPPKALLPPP